jgi:hypothetical protein
MNSTEPADGGTDRSPSRDFDTTLDALANVEGWLRDGQAHALWRAAREVEAPATIVEIGSYHGRSTIVLASAATVGVDVVAIDPHAGNDRGPGEWHGSAADGEGDHRRFTENLRAARVDDRVVHVREFSQRAHGAVRGDVAMLYVDGAHGYPPAKSDIEDWGSRVHEGGRMMIHDTYNSFFVSLAVIRTLYLSRCWAYEGRERSLASYSRRRLSGRAWIRNISRQLAEIPRFVRNMAIKTLQTAGADRFTRLLGHKPGEMLY